MNNCPSNCFNESQYYVIVPEKGFIHFLGELVCLLALGQAEMATCSGTNDFGRSQIAFCAQTATFCGPREWSREEAPRTIPDGYIKRALASIWSQKFKNHEHECGERYFLIYIRATEMDNGPGLTPSFRSRFGGLSRPAGLFSLATQIESQNQAANEREKLD